MTGNNVIRFARPAEGREPAPDPSADKIIEVPLGESPHAFFSHAMRLWTISAGKTCGARWCWKVLQNQLAYFEARISMGADIGGKEE